ncbi:MAG TPA: MarR family transcriptional regulator [Opitutaceae bacterium]
MSVSYSLSEAREALLSIAREHSPVEELQCHALLELFETCHSLHDTLRRELAQHGLTENGFRILAFLVHREGGAAAPAEICRQLSLTRRIVSAALGRLEVSDLVATVRSDAGRRTFAMQVTAVGRKAFAAALVPYLEAITQLMSVLDDRDLTALDQACARLRQFSSHTPNR